MAAAQGQPDDFSSFMTAVIDRGAYSDHVGYIDHALGPGTAAGACRVIAGGTYSDQQGFFIAPTVIECADPLYRSMREEIFGPVLSVFVYDDSKQSYWEDVCR